MVGSWLFLGPQGRVTISINLLLRFLAGTPLELPEAASGNTAYRAASSDGTLERMRETIFRQAPGLRKGLCRLCGISDGIADCRDCGVQDLCVVCIVGHMCMKTVCKRCKKLPVADAHVCPRCGTPELCSFCIGSHGCPALNTVTVPTVGELCISCESVKAYWDKAISERRTASLICCRCERPIQISNYPRRFCGECLPTTVPSKPKESHLGLERIGAEMVGTILRRGAKTILSRWCQCCQREGDFAEGDNVICEVGHCPPLHQVCIVCVKAGHNEAGDPVQACCYCRDEMCGNVAVSEKEEKSSTLVTIKVMNLEIACCVRHCTGLMQATPPVAVRDGLMSGPEFLRGLTLNDEATSSSKRFTLNLSEMRLTNCTGFVQRLVKLCPHMFPSKPITSISRTRL